MVTCYQCLVYSIVVKWYIHVCFSPLDTERELNLHPPFHSQRCCPHERRKHGVYTQRRVSHWHLSRSTSIIMTPEDSCAVRHWKYIFLDCLTKSESIYRQNWRMNNLVWLMGDKNLKSEWFASREEILVSAFFWAPGAVLTGVVHYILTTVLIARVNMQNDIRTVLKVHLKSEEDETVTKIFEFL